MTTYGHIYKESFHKADSSYLMKGWEEASVGAIKTKLCQRFEKLNARTTTHCSPFLSPSFSHWRAARGCQAEGVAVNPVWPQGIAGMKDE